MPFNICSYVSSKLSGNSLRNWRRFGGKQCRSVSNWQNTHLNLYNNVRNQCKFRVVLFPYIPSALSVSASMTRVLSLSLHLFIAILGDKLTTFRTYSAISAFCPLSSCRETEQNAN